MKVNEVFELIKNTPGALDKKSILKNHMNDIIANIFEDAYSDRKYHVKKYEIRTDIIGKLSIDTHYYVFRRMLDVLTNREVTGKKAIDLVETTISLFVKEDQWILSGVLNKNLKIGISKDNYNSIFNNQIDNFEVALAYNLEKVKGVDVLDGNWFASRKCDGVRCVAFCNWNLENKEYNITFKSRQGKEFKTLDIIKPVISKALIDMQEENTDGYDCFENFVIDGEMCILDENGDEHFNKIMKEITRKDHTIKNPHYKMFDILCPGIAPSNEWRMLGYDDNDDCEGLPFEDRYGLLKDLESYISEKQYASVLNQELITSQEDFDRWSKYVSDYGWEGFMLRKNEVYKSGRIKGLLKIKKFCDNEYVVEDIITGKATYNKGGAKEYDVCSAVVINHKGNKVEVGSGISFEQRIKWFNNPEEIIGKTITVQYFEETTNKNNDLISLRFPVLKHVYENGRDC